MDHLLSKELLLLGCSCSQIPTVVGCPLLFDGGLVVEWASVLLPPNMEIPGRTYTLIDRTECLNGAL